MIPFNEFLIRVSAFVRKKLRKSYASRDWWRLSSLAPFSSYLFSVSDIVTA